VYVTNDFVQNLLNNDLVEEEEEEVEVEEEFTINLQVLGIEEDQVLEAQVVIDADYPAEEIVSFSEWTPPKKKKRT
jgi:hypothetical protein